MTNPTHCARCRAEFGAFTWKHRCYRCEMWFCSKHLVEITLGEARRRLGGHVNFVPDGEGLCNRCDEQRVTAARDGEREAFAETDLVHFSSGYSPDWLLIDRVFRVAAIVEQGDVRLYVLVPQAPWDTSMWLARGKHGALEFVAPKDEAQVWARFEEIVLATRSDFRGANEGARPGFLAGFLRTNWSDAEVESRQAWVARLADGSAVPQDAPHLAQWALDLTRSAGDRGVRPPPGAGAAADATLLALAGLSVVERDAAVAKVRGRLREVARSRDLTEAKRRLDAAALELEAAGAGPTSNDGMSAIQSGLAILLRWLATGRKGLLADATEAANAHPLTVAIGALSLKRTNELDRALKSLRGARTEFPWVVLYERVRSSLDTAGHWSRQPLGRLPLESRLGQGTYKEVWTLLGRPSVVVSIAKPGHDAAVRDEVDVLRDLASQIGRAGELLGIQRIQEAGAVELDGVRRVAFITPRLSESPAGVTWPTARRVVEAARSLADLLSDLHRLGYAHGDVKPANVMWDSAGRAVLIDYGGAVKLGPDGTAPAVQHTVEFSAPEVLRDTVITAASDCFSWATTLQTWLRQAPDGPLRNDVARHHCALWDAIDRARVESPLHRPTWTECIDVLSRWLVFHDEPPSRLSSADSQVHTALTDFQIRWVQPLEPATRGLLGEALRDEHLPSHTGTRSEEEALSRQWLELAKNLTNTSLWAVWAGLVCAADEQIPLIAALEAALTDSGSQDGRDPCRQLLEALNRQRESLGLTLSQTAYFLESRRYDVLQASLLAWRQRLSPDANLTELVTLLRNLGTLRNKLEHGARDDDQLPYGRAENGKVVLSSDDTAAVRADTMALLDAVLVKR